MCLGEFLALVAGVSSCIANIALFCEASLPDYQSPGFFWYQFIEHGGMHGYIAGLFFAGCAAFISLLWSSGKRFEVLRFYYSSIASLSLLGLSLPWFSIYQTSRFRGAHTGLEFWLGLLRAPWDERMGINQPTAIVFFVGLSVLMLVAVGFSRRNSTRWNLLGCVPAMLALPHYFMLTKLLSQTYLCELLAGEYVQVIRGAGIALLLMPPIIMGILVWRFTRRTTP